MRFLNSKTELLQQYQEVLDFQRRNNIIEEVKHPNIVRDFTYYIPHQPVYKKEKKKVRIVYDASAGASKNTLSLNQCLHTGLLLLKNLTGIILRFRLHPVIILADIEKAFLQVALSSKDRDFTRFLWARDPKKDLQPNNLIIYRFCRVAFGLTCAPFLLAAAIFTHFARVPSELSSEILLNLYVDNVMLCAQNSEIANKKALAIKEEFNSFGMNLREFISNKKESLNNIEESDKIDTHINKVLGIYWNLQTDNLLFDIQDFSVDQIINKQSVLSFIAAIFDPLGILSPALLPLKIFFQKLWEFDLKWTDPLQSELRTEWLNLTKSISCTLKVPRYLDTLNLENKQSKYDLHAFSDASGYAFSCCIYLRRYSPNTSLCNSTLIFAKAKVYPKRLKNKLSIHRAELIGLLIATRALKFCYNELICDTTLKNLLSLKLALWTDSSTVLHWLRSSTPQERFIENRLKEISQTENLVCSYVQTAENPADIASRGCKFNELENNKLWWKGPPWLENQNISNNSTIPSFVSNTQNFRATTLKIISNFLASLNPIIDPNRFSSWTKLVNTVAYVLRFLKHTSTSKSTHLSANERNYAQLKLFTIAQNANPPHPDEIISLNMVKEQHIYRCKGRLEYSNLPYASKYPIYLPPKSRFTKLYVFYAHKLLLHPGPLTLLSHIRQTHWLPQGRRTIRRIIHKYCLRCRKLTGTPFQRPMVPSLPRERVNPSFVFQHCGVNYFGPFTIKEGKYGAAFLLAYLYEPFI